MKIILITLFVLNMSNYTFAQKECRETEVIVNELIEDNYVINCKISSAYYPIIDSQYVRFEELKMCLTSDELLMLTTNRNNVVRYYAWKAFLLINPKKALQYLIENKEDLQKREVVEFLNGCQGYINIKLIDFMKFELYDRLLDDQITLSAEELIIFLKFKEKRSKAQSIEYNDEMF